MPFRDYKLRVESVLERVLPTADTEPVRLHRAMRYASLNGGKRIRAMLLYAAGQAVAAEPDCLDLPACAVELIHAYSLVHDDLPAMDDDTLRRGQPTCHIAYDEATAILVGDGLQSLAFEILSRPGTVAAPVEIRLQMVGELAHAAGHAGMVGGQMRDIAAEGGNLTIEQLNVLHHGKTGALIRAAVILGALCGVRQDPAILRGLERFAEQIGLAFQIIDDILDEESDAETLGKNSGVDRALSKATYPSTIGLDASREMARHCHSGALSELEKLDADTHLLGEIADLVVNRRH